jgi:hypothetical protein
VDLLRPAASATVRQHGEAAGVAVAQPPAPGSAFEVTGAGAPGRVRQWRIDCSDVASRERFVTVVAEHGRVVLVGPPGESAVLTSGQLSRLRTVLREAADEAER